MALTEWKMALTEWRMVVPVPASSLGCLVAICAFFVVRPDSQCGRVPHGENLVAERWDWTGGGCGGRIEALLQMLDFRPVPRRIVHCFYLCSELPFFCQMSNGTLTPEQCIIGSRAIAIRAYELHT